MKMQNYLKNSFNFMWMGSRNFSLNRLLSECYLPKGNTYTFWGKGVSQGHSDAIRQIEGVKDAKQYTIPIEKQSKK